MAARQALRLADLVTLGQLGVDVDRYASREYERTQEIADAAFFLGFDGLVAPSARWPCLNLALFTERVSADRIQIIETPDEPIDWDAWRNRTRK